MKGEGWGYFSGYSNDQKKLTDAVGRALKGL